MITNIPTINDIFPNASRIGYCWSGFAQRGKAIPQRIIPVKTAHGFIHVTFSRIVIVLV